MASTAVEAPLPPADVVPRGHEKLVGMKQQWKTQTVSDRDKDRKGRRNSDGGKKPAAQGSEAASRARSEGLPPLKREGSRRSRSRSRSPRGRAARSRSPERSR